MMLILTGELDKCFEMMEKILGPFGAVKLDRLPAPLRQF